ncbi:MAG: hypothetical protein JO156_13110, partial [Solirubrobacterales bacterium]|nr:hypothetical protein [Solirubrobacterales bacterium]
MARLRGGAHRASQPDAVDPWSVYLARTEPALAAHARVHRFARVPIIAAGSSPALPIAVWIEDTDPSAVARTRQALVGSTRAPAELLDGPLPAALASTRARHVALLRGGDVLAPLALERLGQAAALAPDAAVITCDDDRLDGAGRRHGPRFRPGPSPDRWLACDDSGPLLVVARERASRALRDCTGGPAWRHELALALAGPASASHAHVPLLLCHRGPEAPTPPPLAADVLASLLAQWEPGASIEQAGTARRIHRPLQHEPSVEVIVCLRDRPQLLARCVVSVLARTRYERLSVALV